MKFIQFMTLTLAAVFFFTISVAAQPGQSRGQGRTQMNPEQRKAQMERFATTLELNEEQKESYFQMEEGFAKKMQELRSGSQGDRMAMREGMMKLRQEREESIKALLNEEQLVQYNELMAQRRNRAQMGQQQAQEAQQKKEKGAKKKDRKKKKNKKKEGEGDN